MTSLVDVQPPPRQARRARRQGERDKAPLPPAFLGCVYEPCLPNGKRPILLSRSIRAQEVANHKLTEAARQQKLLQALLPGPTPAVQPPPQPQPQPSGRRGRRQQHAPTATPDPVVACLTPAATPAPPLEQQGGFGGAALSSPDRVSFALPSAPAKTPVSCRSDAAKSTPLPGGGGGGGAPRKRQPHRGSTLKTLEDVSNACTEESRSYHEVQTAREFFTPELMLKEMADVEAYTTGPQRHIRAGIPNVVHTLFHLMLCKETQFYRNVKGQCSLVEVEGRLSRILRADTVCRERFSAVLQALFPGVTVSPSDSEVLFDLVDSDGNGDVGVAEIANGMLLLLADDIHALLQRCRNIVSVRPLQSLSLVYLSRYELLLLVETLLSVYKGDPEYPTIYSDLTEMVNSFDFNLRGRIQLEAFHRYCRNESGGRVERWMVEALDRYASQGNTELSKLTVFERTAGEDDQERVYTSRKNNLATVGAIEETSVPVGRRSRPVNAFVVAEDAQMQVRTPRVNVGRWEALRGGEYCACSLVSEDKEGDVAVVEWQDGGVSTVDAHMLRSTARVQPRVSLVAEAEPHDVSMFTEEVTQLLETQKGTQFRKNKLIPVAPLRERIVQEDFTKNGNVILPKLEISSSAQFKVDHLSKAARMLGMTVSACKKGRSRNESAGSGDNRSPVVLPRLK